MDENPYSAPESPVVGPGAGPGKAIVRPTSATVFAILNLVFGGYVLICTPISLAITAFVRTPAGQAVDNPFLQVTQDPTYKTGIFILGAFSIVGAFVLVLSGIGLLKLKPWGRTLAIAYGIYALVQLVSGLIFNYFLLIRPLMGQMGNVDDPAVRGGMIGGLIATLGGSVLGLIYPCLLLFFMYRPNVVAAYRRLPTDVWT